MQHQSAHCVTLSWNHPDEELPQYQKDNYLYLVSCHSQNHDFQQMPRGENAILEDLDPSTEYTCQVSLAPSLTENETATITFTTIGMKIFSYSISYFITIVFSKKNQSL